MNIFIFSKLVILFLVVLSQALKFVPERSNVTYFSKKHVGWARAFISRLGRRSPYYLNVEGVTLQTWTNNVTFNFIFYEYLHNEYRRSFVEIHFKFCDMINSDPYVGQMLATQGVTCPAPPKEYRLINMSISMDNFPSTWPFQKCRIDGEFTLTETKEVIVKGYLYASFR